MHITLRPARIEDAAALAELGRITFCQNFAHLYTEQNLQGFLEGNYAPKLQAEEIAHPENHITLAVDGEGALVGYAKSGRCKLPVDAPAQPSYELHRLYLLPEAQGSGAGAALMQDALDYFRAAGAASVYIGVWAENHRAQAFYKRFGFTQVGEYHFMVGDHADDEFILQKCDW